MAENVFQSRETERKEVSKLFLNHGIMKNYTILRGLPGGSDSKESAYNAGDPGLIHGWRTSPGGGHGNPLQYSCLENPHGERSLAGYSPWGFEELDMTWPLNKYYSGVCGQRNWRYEGLAVSYMWINPNTAQGSTVY